MVIKNIKQIENVRFHEAMIWEFELTDSGVALRMDFLEIKPCIFQISGKAPKEDYLGKLQGVETKNNTLILHYFDKQPISIQAEEVALIEAKTVVDLTHLEELILCPLSEWNLQYEEYPEVFDKNVEEVRQAIGSLLEKNLVKKVDNYYEITFKGIVALHRNGTYTELISEYYSQLNKNEN